MARLLLLIAFALCYTGQPAITNAREPLPEVTLELVVHDLFAPIFLVAPPDGSGRRVIGDQIGIAYVITADGTRLEAPFIDLRDQLTPLLEAFDERGLLALAFHPNFARNRLLYVNYSAKRRPGSPFTGKTAGKTRPGKAFGHS